MAKKIQNKDLFDGNVFEPTTSQAESFLKVVNEITDASKKLLTESIKISKSTPFEGYDNLEKISKGVEGIENATATLTKAEQARAKILEKINQQTRESQKTFAELEKQLIEQKNALKDLNKEQKKQGANIDEISKKRAKLKTEILATQKAIRDEQKAIKEGLTLQGKQSELTKAEALEREILKQQIIAGRKELREEAKLKGDLLDIYQKQSKELNNTRKQYKNLFLETEKNRKGLKGLIFRFTSAGKELRQLKEGIDKGDKALKDLDDSVGQNQRSVGKYEKALKGLNSTLTKLGVAGIALKALEGLNNAFSSNSRTGAELQKVFGILTVSISVFVSRIADAIPTIKNLFSDFGNSFKRSLLEIQLSIAKTPLIGDDKRAKEIQSELDSLAKNSGASLSDLGKAFEGIGDEISKTIEANNKLIDTTLLYREEISGLIEDQSKLLAQEAKLEIASGDNTLSLAERAKAVAELNKVQEELNGLSITIASKELELSRQRLKVNKDDISAREAVAQSVFALEEARAKAVTDSANALKEARDIESDDIERNLDFIIDVADKRKTVNERIIADETVSFDRREMLLTRNQEITKQLFDEAIKELQRGAKETIDFNELLNESDNKVISQKLKNAGLNDRLVGRGLELIRERIVFNQDLTESERDLNRAEIESNEIARDTIIVEKALLELQKEGIDATEVLNALSSERTQLEIDNIQLRLKTVESGSAEEIRLQNELSNKLLDQAKTRNEKEINAERVKQQRLQEIRQLGLDSFRSIVNKNQDATLSAIDNEINALEQRESTLRALAERGVENVENNLAIEQKRRAELEAKRAQAVRRQQNIELGLSVLETYSNKVGAGDPNALGSTTRDTSLLLGFINSLPAFWEGSDRLGDDVSPIMQGRDGIVARFDKDEMVMNTQQAGMIRASGMSRGEVAQMAYMTSKGQMATSVSDNTMVVNELRELRNAIESKPVHDFKYDAVRNAVIDVIERKGKIERRSRKNSTFF